VTNPFDPNINTGITVASGDDVADFGPAYWARSDQQRLAVNNGSLPASRLSSAVPVSSGSLTANVMQDRGWRPRAGPGVGFGTADLPFATMGRRRLWQAQPSPTIRKRFDWRGAAAGPDRPHPANTSGLGLAAPGTIYDGGLFLSGAQASISCCRRTSQPRARLLRSQP